MPGVLNFDTNKILNCVYADLNQLIFDETRFIQFKAEDRDQLEIAHTVIKQIKEKYHAAPRAK